MNLGQNIHIWRLELGLTQGELAARTHIPQPRISAIEKGRDFKVSTLQKFADALEITMEDLIKGIQPKGLNKQKIFQRADIERIIKTLVSGRSETLRGEDARLVGMLAALDPRIKKRISKKETLLSWMKLRNLMTHGEIRAVVSRIRKARQRLPHDEQRSR